MIYFNLELHYASDTHTSHLYEVVNVLVL